MDTKEDVQIRRATKEDVDELLRLYFMVYGNSYPLPLGSDRNVMSGMIESDDCFWVVAQCGDRNIIVGSLVLEMDLNEKIGKLAGMVVHPEHRRKDIASVMTRYVTRKFLEEEAVLNSIYTTTRTISRGPQLVCLKNGFIPLGIFPNAHKLVAYETVTLFVKFREAALERRMKVPALPEKLVPIWKAMNMNTGCTYMPEVIETGESAQALGTLDFEIIEAEHFVRRRFSDSLESLPEHFYPFHTPNVLVASTNGEVELYAYLNRSDRYCTIVASSVKFDCLAGRMEPLIDKLCDEGAEYMETLIDINDTESINVLLNEDFIPSAIYPAMKETDGNTHDFLVMSRTMIPLNFKGMDVVQSLKPFIDQYVELWKRMHLETLEVFNDYEKTFRERP